MPSNFLTPFLELDEQCCKNFRNLEATNGSQQQPEQQRHSLRVLGFQRRHSLCPVTLPNSKFNGGSSEFDDSSCCWGLSSSSIHPQQQEWNQEGRLPCSSLSHIPFRVDRSVSMIEGSLDIRESVSPPLLVSPPPGLGSASSLPSSPTSGCTRPLASSSPPQVSTRYKTELCRTYDESGTCKYGAKCQFAHGVDELRGLSRHPKYKTEPCRTFHTIGFCPYGARCHFIHNADEISGGSHATAAAAPVAQKQQKVRPPMLRHSRSFAGFSSAIHSFQSLEKSQQGAPPSSLLFTRASSVSPSPPDTGSSELLSPLFVDPGALQHSFPLSSIPDLAGEDLSLHFCAVTDSASSLPSKGATLAYSLLSPPATTSVSVNPPPGLQRCSSADSLSEEGYTSSCSLSSSSSSAESPSFEGRRLPIFSRLSVSDE